MRFRLSEPARSDLARILAVSSERGGTAGRRRYAALLADTMRRAAANPDGPATRSQEEILPRLRSIHLRHVRLDDPAMRVRRPVHILYYRAMTPDLIEIIRIPHERMAPSRHLADDAENPEQP